MKKTILLLIALLILTACSSTSADITGDWELVSYGEASNPTPAIPNVDTSIKFEDNQMNGNVGCNGFGGSYKLNGNQITFSGVMSTMMYCEETMAQEQAVLSVFSDNVGLQIQLNGDSLIITSADGLSVINLARK